MVNVRARVRGAQSGSVYTKTILDGLNIGAIGPDCGTLSILARRTGGEWGYGLVRALPAPSDITLGEWGG